MDLLTKALFLLVLSISLSAYQSRSRLKIKSRIRHEPNDLYNCTKEGEDHRNEIETCVYDKYGTGKVEVESDIKANMTQKTCCYIWDALCVDSELIRSESGVCTVEDEREFVHWAVQTQYRWREICRDNHSIVVNKEKCRPLIRQVRDECHLNHTYEACYEWITPTTTQGLDDTTKADESDGTTNGSDDSNTGPDGNGDIPGDTRTSTPRSGAQYLCLSVEIVIVFVATLLNF